MFTDIRLIRSVTQEKKENKSFGMDSNITKLTSMIKGIDIKEHTDTDNRRFHHKLIKNRLKLITAPVC